VPTSRAEILRLPLRCDLSAPRLARTALDRLDAIGPVHDDALLAASELATHAVLRASSAPDEEIELTAELVADGVRIAVMGSHAQRSGQHAGIDGLRLRVIQAIARRYGAELTNGQRVWTVLEM
jgi:hypothetical protein